MPSHPLQVEVPEWYTAGFMPPEKQESSFERDMAGLDLAKQSEASERMPVAPTLEHWEVLSGGHLLSECRDTVRTLSCRTRGFLLDTSRIATLQLPTLHTMFCLSE